MSNVKNKFKKKPKKCKKKIGQGCIPVQLSLAPTSLSSPTMPLPIYRMISRQSFLHIVLEDVVRVFHEYAPNMNYMMGGDFQSIDQGDDISSRDPERETIDSGSGNGSGNTMINEDKIEDKIENDNDNDKIRENKNDEEHDDDDEKKKKNGSENEKEEGIKSKADEGSNPNNTSNNDLPHHQHNPYPICWFEDEKTGTVLRWHIFIGVLYDLMRLKDEERQR